MHPPPIRALPPVANSDANLGRQMDDDEMLSAGFVQCETTEMAVENYFANGEWRKHNVI